MYSKLRSVLACKNGSFTIPQMETMGIYAHPSQSSSDGLTLNAR